MRIRFLLIISVLLTPMAVSAADQTQTSASLLQSQESGYGNSEKSPIKVRKKGLSGPASERSYLDSLRGPKGETLMYTRVSSCCPFQTPNGILGSGMLDKYAVLYEGAERRIFLYLDMYDPQDADAPAPDGLTLVVPQETEPSAQSKGADLAADPRRESEAWKVCRQLPGYASLRESFEIHKAMMGFINFPPESLFVELVTTKSGILNAIWWWDPLADGKPSLDWAHLLKLHAQATKVISKHQWLSEWREVSPGRLVELHAIGEGIGEDKSSLEYFILPVWRDAGLKGNPTYSVLLRRSDRGWAKVYFGNDDPRALVAANEPDASTGHWLDGLDVYFHPRCKPDDKTSRYVIVEPSGKWILRSFSHCQP